MAWELDPITTTEPGSAEQTVATGTAYDGQGNPQADVDVWFRLISTGSEGIFPGAPFKATSDDDGLVEVSLLKDSTYEGRRGTGSWIEFDTDAEDTFDLDAAGILGGDNE